MPAIDAPAIDAPAIDVLAVSRLPPLYLDPLRAAYRVHDRLQETDPAAFEAVAPRIRAVAAGGHIMRDKFSIGQYGHIALCFDTEGNMFGLHSMT